MDDGCCNVYGNLDEVVYGAVAESYAGGDGVKDCWDDDVEDGAVYVSEWVYEVGSDVVDGSYVAESESGSNGVANVEDNEGYAGCCAEESKAASYGNS